MKIYVDGEMPKSCFDCIVCQKDDLGYWCGDENCYISDENVGNRRLSECPLQSLAEYEKQVRKQVVKEIRAKLDNSTCRAIFQDCEWFGKQAVYDCLDQVERSEKDDKS